VGAVLAGSRAFIDEAWRCKYRFGGAMRQAGIIAAGALYALNHNVERLADDHANARRLAEGLAAIDGITLDPASVETNLVFFDVAGTGRGAGDLAAALRARGVRIGDTGPTVLRAVTYLDVDADDIERALVIVREVIAG
jgi:threonine aldolase